jgi:hypothetical protein
MNLQRLSSCFARTSIKLTSQYHEYLPCFSTISGCTKSPLFINNFNFVRTHSCTFMVTKHTESLSLSLAHSFLIAKITRPSMLALALARGSSPL